MKASELIEKLEKAIEDHGDCEVYSGGEDYPGPVDSITYVTEHTKTAYEPSRTLRIHSRD